jgi:hypothetical protein
MKRFTILAVVAVFATSCAAPAASPAAAPEPASTSAAPTPTILPAGKFKLTAISGAEITFTLPTPATDPTVAKLEAFRKKAGGEPVAYVVADVDNRKGTEYVNMYQINAFDAEGIQYTFSTVTDAIDGWGPEYGSDYKYTLPNGKALDDATGDALQRESVALHNANLNGADIAERKTLILASPTADLPKEFTRVSVQPSSGGEGEDAQPAS